MTAVIQAKLGEVARACGRRRVRRLALFGSAAQDRFVGGESDLDLLVELEPMTPAERAEAYFGLSEDLEALFDLPVDLLESDAVRNPYLREEIERTQVVLYEAP